MMRRDTWIWSRWKQGLPTTQPLCIHLHTPTWSPQIIGKVEVVMAHAANINNRKLKNRCNVNGFTFHLLVMDMVALTLNADR